MGSNYASRLSKGFGMLYASEKPMRKGSKHPPSRERYDFASDQALRIILAKQLEEMPLERRDELV